MGSWNGTCGLTNLPITSGERAVWLPLMSTRHPGAIYYNPSDLYMPMGFAIRGSYNDYGCIEKIDETTPAKLMLEYFKDLIKIKELINVSENKHDKMALKTIDDLVKLVEREYLVTIDSSNDVLKGLRATGRLVGCMMFHEKAYDCVLTEISGRIPYGKNKTTEFYIVQQIKKWMNEISSDEHDRMFNMSHYRFVRYVEDNLSGGSYYLDRIYKEKLKSMIPAIVEHYLFHIAMNYLRKMYMPQNGSGSQCDEMVLHTHLAGFVSDHLKKKFTQWKKENKEDDSYIPFVETPWVD